MSNLKGHMLTPAQAELMDLLCEGRVAKQAAEELRVPIGSVREHIREILKKLGATKIHHATAIWKELKLTGKAAVGRYGKVCCSECGSVLGQLSDRGLYARTTEQLCTPCFIRCVEGRAY